MPFLPPNWQRTKVNLLHCTSPSQGKITHCPHLFWLPADFGRRGDGDAILPLHLLSDANAQEPLEVIEVVSQPTVSNHWLNLRQWCRPVRVIHLILFFFDPLTYKGNKIPHSETTLWGIKKHTKILLCITSRNINRFSKFFHWWIQEDICYKSVAT